MGSEIIERDIEDEEEKIEQNAPQQEEDQEVIKAMEQALKLDQPLSHRNQFIEETAGKFPCGCEPRVLIVDDQRFNIFPIQKALREDHRIIADTAMNGMEALTLFKKGYDKPCKCPFRAYRLIIMDLQMPVMGGLDASRKIIKLMTESGEYGQIPRASLLIDGVNEDNDLTHIVPVTSYQNFEDKCAKVGMRQVHYKPINPSVVFEIVKRHFERLPEEEVQFAIMLREGNCQN